MPHYKEEWRERASIDYFSHFLALWVGFNSWYVDYYRDYEYLSTNKKPIKSKQDLHFISIIKTEFQTPTNIMFNIFEGLILENNKKAIKFRSDLEALYYSLNNIDYITYKDKLGNPVRLSFNYVNISAFDRKPNYINMVEVIRDKFVRQDDEDYSAELITYGVIVPLEEFFAGIIEILYKVRCCIVHGATSPQDSYSYEVVKYCYYVLYALMEDE